MENATYIGLSRQIALGRKMDIIANNIANIDTAGFKGERAIFEEFLVKSTNKREVSLVQDKGIYRDTTNGPIIKTGNAFDLSITNNTFFVLGSENQINYSNNGRFQLSGDGTLTNHNGIPVLDINDEPIVINEEDGQINISENGIINGKEGEIAQLRIVTFDDLQRLKKVGGGLYNSTEVPLDLTGNPDTDLIADIKFTIKQGTFEGSNVKGIREMTRMMEVVRSYTTTANMVKSDHDLQRKAVDKLGQVVSA